MLIKLLSDVVSEDGHANPDAWRLAVARPPGPDAVPIDQPVEHGSYFCLFIVLLQVINRCIEL